MNTNRLPFIFVLLVTLAAVLAGCASFDHLFGEGAEPSQSGAAADYASLIDSLRAGGATVEPGDEVEQPFFSVTGRIIRVNGMDVQVFEYADETSAAADAALVSPDGGSVGTTMMMWMAAPHFFRAGRVIALYVGDDADVLAALQSALGEQFAGR